MSESIPRVVCVPFGYPDYPKDAVARRIAESTAALSSMGMDVIVCPAVIAREDVERAVDVLRRERSDVIIAVLVSWVEPPVLMAVLRPFQHHPVVLWSHTTFVEDGSLVTLGALPAAGVIRETLEEMGFRFAFTYGMPGDARVDADISIFARAAAAARALLDSRIALFGYASMGIYTGTISHTQLRAQLGPEVEHFDQYTLVQAYEQVTDDEIEPLLGETGRWQMRESVTSQSLRASLRMCAALKRLAALGPYDALTVKCQYELSRSLGVTPCIALSMLADEMVVSCEGDVPLVVTQLMLHYLSGGTTSYGDLHHVTSREVWFGACGFAPFSQAAGRPIVTQHTALYDGLCNSSRYREGRVTLARLGAEGAGFKMHLAAGKTVPVPEFHEVGCPPYPLIAVELSGSTDDFMQNLVSQHYGFCYGDVSAELRALCRLLGVTVIE